MENVARKQGPTEVHALLEAAITGPAVRAAKSGPDRHLAPLFSDNKHSDSSDRLPRRGFLSVVFLCPTCGSRDRFGSEGPRVGHCKRCNFSWARQYDWRVFVDAATGHGFRTLTEFLTQVGP